jgi:hypothetical protein
MSHIAPLTSADSDDIIDVVTVSVDDESDLKVERAAAQLVKIGSNSRKRPFEEDATSMIFPKSLQIRRVIFADEKMQAPELEALIEVIRSDSMECIKRLAFLEINKRGAEFANIKEELKAEINTKCSEIIQLRRLLGALDETNSRKET